MQNSTHGSAAKLAQAVKDLSLEWQQTQVSWNDLKSQEFEKAYLENLGHDIARAALVIAEIDTVLRKVHADCE